MEEKRKWGEKIVDTFVDTRDFLGDCNIDVSSCFYYGANDWNRTSDLLITSGKAILIFIDSYANFVDI